MLSSLALICRITSHIYIIKAKNITKTKQKTLKMPQPTTKTHKSQQRSKTSQQQNNCYKHNHNNNNPCRPIRQSVFLEPVELHRENLQDVVSHVGSVADVRKHHHLGRPQERVWKPSRCGRWDLRPRHLCELFKGMTLLKTVLWWFVSVRNCCWVSPKCLWKFFEGFW